MYGEVLRGRRIESGVYQYKDNKFVKLRSKNALTLSIKSLTKAELPDAEYTETLIRFDKDLEGIYHLESENGENPILYFQKEDGELDEFKVYYQGNPLHTCFKFQDIAYECLEFLAYMNEIYLEQFDLQRQEEILHTYVPFAQELINLYKVLRMRKLTETELRKVRVFTKELKPRTKSEREQLKRLQEVVQIA